MEEDKASDLVLVMEILSKIFSFSPVTKVRFFTVLNNADQYWRFFGIAI
jgi:hypothetical protein